MASSTGSEEDNRLSPLPDLSDEFTQATSFAGVAARSAIGPYHLLQVLGEGGMGQVWLAEQKQPVRRRVALKLIRAGMNTREVVGRFESERQALALMDHPAIAKVYDAGTTPEGTPFFVMEYVAGVPITEYCDSHKLSTKARLQLFSEVCQGVQHAHQKAIIHRDLKPSNILVSETDGMPSPKIIDFGVAKALSQKLTDATMYTRVGAMIGTPEYMSPEQARSGGEDIDTRTDVYSLGVILYELLVGTRPLDLKITFLEDLLRKLREDEIPKPSTKLRTLAGGDSSVAAHNRQTETGTLMRQLRGDLDCITLKCLEKERARRYVSPSELAADIARYLNNEPVLATPPSTVYLTRKFVQRYRTAMITIGLIFLVCIFAAIFSSWQAVRALRSERLATAQRDRADAEAAKATAIDNFLQHDLLEQASSDAGGAADGPPDADVKVRVLLDRAAKQIGTKFEGKPRVEAAIRTTVGNAYRDLGLYTPAETQLRASYELLGRTLGRNHVETLEALENLSDVISDQDRYDEALKLNRAVLTGLEKQLGPNHPKTAVAMQDLGTTQLFLGQSKEAEALFKRALAIQIKDPGYDNLQTLNTSDSLVAVYLNMGRFAEAEALLARGLESYRRVYGPEHPYTQREMFGLARVYFDEGKYDQAERGMSDVLTHNRRIKGENHQHTLSTARYLGRIYTSEGRYAEAEKLLLATRLADTKTFGPENIETLAVSGNLGSLYMAQGNFNKAGPILNDTLAGYKKKLGPQHVNTLRTANNLAACLLAQGKARQAESLLRQTLDRRKEAKDDDWERFYTEALLGSVLLTEGDKAEGKSLLTSGLRGMQAQESKMPASDKPKLRKLEEQLRHINR